MFDQKDELQKFVASITENGAYAIIVRESIQLRNGRILHPSKDGRNGPKEPGPERYLFLEGGDLRFIDVATGKTVQPITGPMIFDYSRIVKIVNGVPNPSAETDSLLVLDVDFHGGNTEAEKFKAANIKYNTVLSGLDFDDDKNKKIDCPTLAIRSKGGGLHFIFRVDGFTDLSINNGHDAVMGTNIGADVWLNPKRSPWGAVPGYSLLPKYQVTVANPEVTPPLPIRGNMDELVSQYFTYAEEKHKKELAAAARKARREQVNGSNLGNAGMGGENQSNPEVDTALDAECDVEAATHEADRLAGLMSARISFGDQFMDALSAFPKGKESNSASGVEIEIRRSIREHIQNGDVTGLSSIFNDSWHEVTANIKKREKMQILKDIASTLDRIPELFSAAYPTMFQTVMVVDKLSGGDSHFLNPKLSEKMLFSLCSNLLKNIQRDSAVEGQRNNRVFSLACEVSKYRLSLDKVTDIVSSAVDSHPDVFDGFGADEVSRACSSAYSHIEDRGELEVKSETRELPSYESYYEICNRGVISQANVREATKYFGSTIDVLKRAKKLGIKYVTGGKKANMENPELQKFLQDKYRETELLSISGVFGRGTMRHPYNRAAESEIEIQTIKSQIIDSFGKRELSIESIQQLDELENYAWSPKYGVNETFIAVRKETKEGNVYYDASKLRNSEWFPTEKDFSTEVKRDAHGNIIIADIDTMYNIPKPFLHPRESLYKGGTPEELRAAKKILETYACILAGGEIGSSNERDDFGHPTLEAERKRKRLGKPKLAQRNELLYFLELFVFPTDGTKYQKGALHITGTPGLGKSPVLSSLALFYNNPKIIGASEIKDKFNGNFDGLFYSEHDVQLLNEELADPKKVEGIINRYKTQHDNMGRREVRRMFQESKMESTREARIYASNDPINSVQMMDEIRCVMVECETPAMPVKDMLDLLVYRRAKNSKFFQILLNMAFDLIDSRFGGETILNKGIKETAFQRELKTRLAEAGSITGSGDNKFSVCETAYRKTQQYYNGSPFKSKYGVINLILNMGFVTVPGYLAPRDVRCNKYFGREVVQFGTMFQIPLYPAPRIAHINGGKKDPYPNVNEELAKLCSGTNRFPIIELTTPRMIEVAVAISSFWRFKKFGKVPQSVERNSVLRSMATAFSQKQTPSEITFDSIISYPGMGVSKVKGITAAAYETFASFTDEMNSDSDELQLMSALNTRFPERIDSESGERRGWRNNQSSNLGMWDVIKWQYEVNNGRGSWDRAGLNDMDDPHKFANAVARDLCVGQNIFGIVYDALVEIHTWCNSETLQYEYWDKATHGEHVEYFEKVINGWRAKMKRSAMEVLEEHSDAFDEKQEDFHTCQKPGVPHEYLIELDGEMIDIGDYPLGLVSLCGVSGEYLESEMSDSAGF